MDAGDDADAAVSGIAAAIGEPARTRILYHLMDGQARTSTELATVAEVSPSTASVHLHRLRDERLVEVLVRGKHRYYSLGGPDVARALEALSVLAGGRGPRFVPRAPSGLRAARTCYDHLAGRLGVALLDRLRARKWLLVAAGGRKPGYELTPEGAQAFDALGIDLEASRARRRRFAYPCVDWSERRPHVGGALGASLFQVALRRKWVVQDLDSRALEVTSRGAREMEARFGLQA